MHFAYLGEGSCSGSLGDVRRRSANSQTRLVDKGEKQSQVLYLYIALIPLTAASIIRPIGGATCMLSRGRSRVHVSHIDQSRSRIRVSSVIASFSLSGTCLTAEKDRHSFDIGSMRRRD